VSRTWTHAEEEALRILGPQIGGPACAAAFDRSVEAVRVRAKRLGVSLRRRESLDPILTRPRSEAVLRRIREIQESELCPSCGKRYVGVARTGLCGPCHLEALTIVHEEEIAKADAELARVAAKSKLYRRRRMLARVFPGSGPETGDARATMETDNLSHLRKDHHA
jgi:hypothetical protein